MVDPVSHGYPLMLDVTTRQIVIIGGGNVAARKAEGLLAAGATKIRVISPTFSDRLPAVVERVAEAYSHKHLDGVGLVFAATNAPKVNDAIVHDAHARGLLVNRADGSDAEPGDFSTPAIHRERSVIVTVSTAGSPALAARLRDQIAPHLDHDLLTLADTMRDLRPAVLADPKLDESQRREIFRRLASDEAISILRDGGAPALERWLEESFNVPPQGSAERAAHSTIARDA